MSSTSRFAALEGSRSQSASHSHPSVPRRVPTPFPRSRDQMDVDVETGEDVPIGFSEVATYGDEDGAVWLGRSPHLAATASSKHRPVSGRSLVYPPVDSPAEIIYAHAMSSLAAQLPKAMRVVDLPPVVHVDVKSQNMLEWLDQEAPLHTPPPISKPSLVRAAPDMLASPAETQTLTPTSATGILSEDRLKCQTKKDVVGDPASDHGPEHAGRQGQNVVQSGQNRKDQAIVVDADHPTIDYAGGPSLAIRAAPSAFSLLADPHTTVLCDNAEPIITHPHSPPLANGLTGPAALPTWHHMMTSPAAFLRALEEHREDQDQVAGLSERVEEEGRHGRTRTVTGTRTASGTGAVPGMWVGKRKATF